jgi:hypothetical protein
MALDPQIPLMVQTPPPVSAAPAIAQVDALANAQALNEQRAAIADQRQQQADQLARNAADQAAINSAMQTANGDRDAAADALGKAGMQRAQSALIADTNTQRTAALKQATDAADLHVKTIGTAANLLNAIDPTDPNDYAAKASAVRGMASSDPQIQASLKASLPLPGEPGYDPANIGKYVASTQNAAVPYLDYWKQMQAAAQYQNEGKGPDALARTLTAQAQIGVPMPAMIQSVLAARHLGMSPEVAQPFLDGITQKAYAADPLYFSKLGGVTTPEQAATQTGTVGGVPGGTPTEAATKDQATLAMERARLGIEGAHLTLDQQKEAREAAQAKGGAADIGTTGTFDPNKPSGAAYLATLPQAEARTVQALAEGRIPWPSGSALRGVGAGNGVWTNRVDEALQYDPTLDTATISNNARQKVRADFTSGKSAQTINAMNTVVGHLTDLQQIGTGLSNGPSDTVNAIKNWLVPGGSETGVAINNFDTAKQAVADELTRVYRQAGGSEQDIQSWQSTINAAKSPAELQGAFKTIGGLLESKLGAMQNQYQQGMGTTPVSVVTPQTRGALNKLQGVAAPAMVTIKTPDGRTLSIPASNVEKAKALGATVVGGGE